MAHRTSAQKRLGGERSLLRNLSGALQGRPGCRDEYDNPDKQGRADSKGLSSGDGVQRGEPCGAGLGGLGWLETRGEVV